jgi:hypothetical protein
MKYFKTYESFKFDIYSNIGDLHDWYYHESRKAFLQHIGKMLDEKGYECFVKLKSNGDAYLEVNEIPIAADRQVLRFDTENMPTQAWRIIKDEVQKDKQGPIFFRTVDDLMKFFEDHLGMYSKKLKKGRQAGILD